ncbi:MAG: MAPEG family protein [Sphingosinicella sp.]
MNSHPILAPLVALAAWTMLMMLWLYAVRFPAMRRAGISLKGRIGSKTGSLDGVVEDQVQWKAHNYNHLMEQPTLFYAVCIVLDIVGGGDIAVILYLAWAYVGLRVAHSLVQATINVVRWRFYLFAAASLCLAGLAVYAAATVFYELDEEYEAREDLSEA